MQKEFQPAFAPDTGRGGSGDFPLVNVDTSAVTPHTKDQITDQFRGLIPARLISNIHTEELSTQLNDIAAFSYQVVSGEVTLPSVIDYQSRSALASREVREELLTQSVRGVIATTVLDVREREGRNKLTQVGVNERVDQSVTDLVAMVGHDRAEEVGEVISDLTTVERVILTSAMSPKLTERLGYPDIHDCDEVRFGGYIRGLVGDGEEDDTIVFNRHTRTEVFDRLGILLEAVTERSGITFSSNKVIDEILKAEYPQGVMERLMTISYFSGNIDSLVDFFETSPRTQRLAQRCRQYSDGERRMEVPQWMKDADPIYKMNED